MDLKDQVAQIWPHVLFSSSSSLDMRIPFGSILSAHAMIFTDCGDIKFGLILVLLVSLYN